MTKLIKVLLGLVFLFLVTTGFVFAAGTDVNNDGVVNAADLIKILQNWGLSGSRPEDINQDQKVNLVDAGLVIKDWGQTIETPTPYPTSPPSSGEWTQHGYNAQRTGWNPKQIGTSWSYAWLRSDLGVESNFQVYPVTGGGKVYIAAKNDQVYAVNLSDGTNAWVTTPGGGLYSTPAYDAETNSLFVSGGSKLYRINAANGQVANSFTAAAAVETSPLLVGNRVYITTLNGNLYALNKNSLSQDWVYTSTGTISQTTMPSYSASRNIVIFGSDPDLNVHAVNAGNGTLKWRVKPTTNNYQCGQMGEGSSCIEFRNNWPVIADNAGIVLLRLRHGYDAMYFASPMPTTNAAIKQTLESNPGYQTLFALNLDNGLRAFTPAVKYGAFGNGHLGVGPQPAIRTLANGEQVAYIVYGNGQVCANTSWCDYRDDTTMGEMVLDNNTVANYQAGDVRFVKFIDIQTDEQGMVSGAGDMVFHSHWIGVLEGLKITNRSDGVGGTFGNPISGSWTPFVIDRDARGCGTDHYCGDELQGEGGNRRYPPGFEVGTSGWHLNPYVTVSGDYVIVKSIDSSIFVLKHN